MKLRPFLFSTLFSLLGSLSPELAHAQFVGYVSPQTAQQTLANNLACTGALQNFPVSNEGQSAHSVYLNLTSGLLTQGTMVVQGSADGTIGSFQNISETASLAGSGGVNPNAFLVGSGYYPIVRVQVLCGVGTNFTLQYQGTSVTPGQLFGAQQITQYEKTIFQSAPANATTTFPQSGKFQPPFGSSAGFLRVSIVGAITAGATATVNCGGILDVGTGSNPLNGFVLANTAGPSQIIPVPAAPCSQLAVQLIGAGGAGAISLDYIFSYPGSVNVADLCGSGFTKSSVVINITSATTTSLVAPLTAPTNASIYSCGFNVTTVGGTFQLEYGTGATCGTGTTVLTGAYPAGNISYGGNGSEVLQPTPGAQRLCAVSGAGLTNAQGVLTFVQF